MFGIIATPAEFERSLIQERVKAVLGHARRNGKKLGRPRRIVDLDGIVRLKAQGQRLRSIANELNIGYDTARQALELIERKTPASGAAAQVEM